MSLSSATTTIKLIHKSSTYVPLLQSAAGDLWQEFEGTQGALSSVVPNFATTLPELAFVATSGRLVEGIVVPVSIEWYFNNVKLIFGSNNVSTNTFSGETGHFESVPYVGGSNPYFKLRIRKNLVNAADLAPCTIKAVAKIVYGNVTDDISAQYQISIARATGTPFRVTISAGDNKYFTLTSKGDSCKIKAVTYLNSAETTTGLSYKWYKLVNGAWSILTGQVSSILTVSDTMVDSYSQFKVEVYKDSNLIGMDTQGVMDATDPYDIILNPTPSDEQIEEGSGGQVVYTPYVVKRGSSQKALDTTFYFTFMDSVGIILNPSSANTAAASGTCSEAMCIQAGGNVSLTIISKD